MYIHIIHSVNVLHNIILYANVARLFYSPDLPPQHDRQARCMKRGMATV